MVLTSLDDERMAQDAIRNGAQDYLVKSLAGLEMLPRVIRHAIERQQSQTALEASRRTGQALLDASHDLARCWTPAAASSPSTPTPPNISAARWTT